MHDIAVFKRLFYFDHPHCLDTGLYPLIGVSSFSGTLIFQTCAFLAHKIMKITLLVVVVVVGWDGGYSSGVHPCAALCVRYR